MFFALFGTPTPALAAELPIPIYASSTAESIIVATAIHYGISGKEFLGTLQCESGLNKNAVGDHDTSFGVAQIHLPAHKDISKEQALDPMWAIDWSARQFAAHNEKIWTCWRGKYGSRTD